MAALLYDLGMVAMRQTWHDVSFLHWPYDPAIVRPLVPPGLELDLYDGAAWIGLVPFTIAGMRVLFPFPETNVRTYVRDRRGGRGVWFFSLDAASLLAVAGARIAYALPYFWARMRVECDGRTARYTSERRSAPAPSSEIEVRIGEPIPNPNELELFLTMRFRLYARRAGILWKADIDHPPWPLRQATVLRLRDDLVRAAGLPKPLDGPLAHYAARVDVKIGQPQLL